MEGGPIAREGLQPGLDVSEVDVLRVSQKGLGFRGLSLRFFFPLEISLGFKV